MSATLDGLSDVYAQLRRLEAGIREAARTRIEGGSPLPYFYKIETGRDRQGNVARHAGPALMVTTAYETVAPTIEETIARAIPGGAERVRNAQRGIAGRITRLARARTPVRSGALRASIHTRTSHRAGAE